MPKVSVIIPCYNYARYLLEAVDSALSQSCADIEVVIVNDGSTDDTREVARAIIASHPERTIRLVDQENQGLPAARNSGLRATACEYYIQLDADDRLAPHCIEKLAQALDRDPGIDFAYPWTMIFGDRSELIRTGEFTWKTMLLRRGPTSTSMVRRAVWEKAGGYNPDMRDGMEDWDFYLTLYESGCKAVVVPEPLFLRRSHGSSMTEGERSDVLAITTRLKLLHPRFFEPFLCGVSVQLAVFAIRLKSWTRDPVARYLYVNFPGLHNFMSRVKYRLIAR